MTSTKNDLVISINAAANGLSMKELTALHPDIPRRSAQRLLAELVKEGHAVTKGKGRGHRYFGVAASPEDAEKDTAKENVQTNMQTNTQSNESFPAFISVSVDSLDILRYINQPIEARKPVGYQREFVESYQPNITWYLSPSLRRQLHEMGKTTDRTQPAGTYSRAILNRLLIDLSWASSHLEGNTYSRLDTRELIEDGRTAQGKAILETQMILNHKSAIELLVENIESVQFNAFTLKNIHSALSENLLPNPADEGRIRQHAVDIGKSVYRPLTVNSQLEEAFNTLLNKAFEINDPFEQSFFMMVHLPYLQPFADINKRTSRLAANLPLFRANLCPLTFLDVPEQAYSRAMLGVYEMTRVELLRDLFVWAYERSTQEYLAIQQHLAQPDPLRFTWRDFIKQTINRVVVTPTEEPFSIIQQAVISTIPDAEQQALQALIIEELRRLHEGVLARYGLRPSQFSEWRVVHELDWNIE